MDRDFQIIEFNEGMHVCKVTDLNKTDPTKINYYRIIQVQNGLVFCSNINDDCSSSILKISDIIQVNEFAQIWANNHEPLRSFLQLES